jgi:L-rhamnose isomerase/sugar isomerase
VKPILEVARMKLGLDPDPLGAFRRSGYAEMILKERSEAPARGRKSKARV